MQFRAFRSLSLQALAAMHDSSIEDFIGDVLETAQAHGAWSRAWRGHGQTGFHVALSTARGRVHADFGGLEAEFESLAAALVWTRRAGGPHWQLRTDSVGACARTWTLERLGG